MTAIADIHWRACETCVNLQTAPTHDEQSKTCCVDDFDFKRNLI